MTEYSGPEDIYKELVEDSSDNWLYGLVAFAVIEEQKIEWMRHCEKNTGDLPSAAEINDWYKQQSRNVLLRAKGTAENALQVYSSEVVDLALEEKRKEIEEGIIVREIRESRKFLRQFRVNFSGGFASTFVFTTLIIIFAFFALNDTSGTQLAAQLKNNLEDRTNGEETGSNE